MQETLKNQTPENKINLLRPDHYSIKRLTGGDNREVFLVDDTEVFRFSKDGAGSEVNRYEFEALKLVQGKLSVGVPRPIELADDGSYNILSFLDGKVLSKQAVTEPCKRRKKCTWQIHRKCHC